jgi:hypothetical protein
VADFILEWVADIKSESGAECTSEPLADIARNQHQAELRKHGILISMSGKGNCYDCESVRAARGT